MTTEQSTRELPAAGELEEGQGSPVRYVLRYALRDIEAEAIQVTPELVGAHLWDGLKLPHDVTMGSASHHREKRKIYSARVVVEDQRRQRHDVQIGEWIVWGPGGRVSVLDTEKFEAMYRPADERREPVAWRRREGGMWVYYESPAWDDLLPLYAAPTGCATGGTP